MTEVEIDYKGVLLEVVGDYSPKEPQVLNPPENAYPGSPSSFEVTSICFDSDMDGDMVDVTSIYESLDEVDKVAKVAIVKIEEA